ncbi:MAG: rane glycosyltransferase, partial [Candidatus Binatota bacterium]|nr:rane glycosyltransferase [Candidatus Binatota bacterium]
MSLPLPHEARVRVRVRRALFGTLVVLTTVLAGLAMADILRTNGMSNLEAAMLALFVILFVNVALSFWTSIFGFWVRMRGGDHLALTRTLAGDHDPSPLPARTAIVMPVYNEDPGRVMAGLEATYRSLEATGFLRDFDFFVLSDTTDPDVWVEEELAFTRLRHAVSDPSRLFYRKRRENLERKAGNISDFCAEWGPKYRYMIVFDADSVMTGEALVKLVRLAERNPDVGIIQAPPVPVNRQTLFGRLQQFGVRAYGPIFLSGLNYWQAGEGNYWGHNAIIRIQPFVEHCKLPKLPGKEPLGGSILSHDFVEAALMRRAGYRVFLADDLEGSYEESPPTLIDYAARDRRWCQGNLQHARLLGFPGLNRVNRLHLLMGVMAYVNSPIWMLLLLLATLEAFRHLFVGHEYFAPQPSLFPMWEISIVWKAIPLYLVVMGMLFVPKILSFFVHLRQRGMIARFGGTLRFGISIVLEAFFSILLAPVMAVLQTRFVITTLLGKSIVWNSQERGDTMTPWGVAARRHGGTTLLGIAWGIATWSYVPELFWWLTPVTAGLVLAIPLSVLSSKVSLGRKAAELGLLLIPEEIDPPPVLRTLHERLAEHGYERVGDGLALVLDDPRVRAVHLSLLPAA